MKRSVEIDGRQTSVSVEDAFWADFKKIAASQDIAVEALVEAINRDRDNANLSSAIRVFVLEYYRR